MISTKPFLAINVAWHPDFVDGDDIALAIFEHYRRNLVLNITGGSGIPVVYRSVPPAGRSVPIDIDMDAAETSAVVLLIDENWAGDPHWVDWATRISEAADKTDLRVLVFPVTIDGSGIAAGFVSEQAVRWDGWSGKDDDFKRRRLFIGLSYQFCRMLRQYLEHLDRPAVAETDLAQYLRPVYLFLSHSKHDPNGKAIALEFLDFLSKQGFGTFFDVYDIPVGLKFNRVLLEKVRLSAVVAIHTDTFSSREWCRREMIEAKRYNVPLVVADCITDIDERGFPYMANVPIVRMDPGHHGRIDAVVARLMDEVLKDFLWRCRVKLYSASGADVAFLPRPPELIVLTVIKDRTPPSDTLVYPDPPIGAEELSLFEKAAPGVKLLSLNEWLAGATI